MVDLTHTLDEQTIVWSAEERFERTQLSYGRGSSGIFYANFSFRCGEHCGTHMDAPLHFAEGRRSIEQIPPARLTGPAFKVNIAEQCSRDTDYRLRPEDLLAAEKRLGRIPEGGVVLIETGWGRYWGNRAKFLGILDNDATTFHFPGIGQKAAELLVGRRIALAGIDTASLDHGPSRDYAAHQILCGAEIPGIENVANLDQLPDKDYLVMALPMKIAGGSGAPCRVVALLAA